MAARSRVLTAFPVVGQRIKEYERQKTRTNGSLSHTAGGRKALRGLPAGASFVKIQNPPGNELTLVPWGISFHTERFWRKAGVVQSGPKPESACFSRLFRLDQYMPPFGAAFFNTLNSFNNLPKKTKTTNFYLKIIQKSQLACLRISTKIYGFLRTKCVNRRVKST